MTDNLFLAILSMDAYNRGYNAGIGGLDAANETKIGDASIILATDSSEDSLARASGFYAVAYDWNDQKVISYRGTDNPTSFDLSNDILTGWLLGAGVSGASQADLALQFFNAVTQRSASDPTWNPAFDNVDDNILVTGHSIGGTRREFPRSGIRNVERRERPTA